VFEKVGGFDPVLNSYGNEKELLIRIRKAGYRTVWVKGSYVHHFGKMSYSKTNINIGRACKDADNYIFKKHAN
jgi:GT2 family glycosyltransferase